MIVSKSEEILQGFPYQVHLQEKYEIYYAFVLVITIKVRNC